MLFIVLLTSVASALAGTPCPPRENIYPCSCLSIPQGKKVFFTSVTCHRLPSTDSLTNIFSTLRTMTIDHFYLYDCFWEANKLGVEGENKQVLPADWLTLLKIKEIEIVDTTLSSCFACSSRLNCRNDVTTRFTAVNSSSHEKICTICSTDSGQKFAWTGCMNKLKEFHFRHGRLNIIRPDLFPLRMAQLTEVDLSYNNIYKIENMAFKNLPKLKVLILSHNALESLSSILTSTVPELETLDVSWNLIKTLGDNFFSAVPKIKSIIANNNYLEHLKEDHFKNPPNSFRTIDLRENPIHCDCDLRWLNGTFHINVVIHGHCATPEDYENSLIRKASRMLNERCTDDGNIGTRKPKTTPKAMFEPL